MRATITIAALFFSFAAAAQIDSIYFNLYTDSLKKGVYNYINVDGKFRDGHYVPLMADELTFTSSAGTWSGNNLSLDTACRHDSVTITAFLKLKPEVKKTIVIYLKKIEIEPPLKTEKELFEDWRRHRN